MDKEILISQLRESFGRVAYSHKTHEKMADQHAFWAWFSDWAEIILITLTTLIGTFGDSVCSKIASGILGALALLVLVYHLKFKPTVQADVHRQAAKKLWMIRERYCSLIGDIMAGVFTAEEARKKRDLILKDLRQIYEAAPATNSRAYRAAQVALKFNEELTFSDKEIDDLLPANLRKNP